MKKRFVCSVLVMFLPLAASGQSMRQQAIIDARHERAQIEMERRDSASGRRAPSSAHRASSRGSYTGGSHHRSHGASSGFDYKPHSEARTGNGKPATTAASGVSQAAVPALTPDSPPASLPAPTGQGLVAPEGAPPMPPMPSLP